jgi:MATE family multidrug resistance protein
MAVSAGSMIGVPELLAAVYTTQPDVALAAVSLIPLAGLFQIFDGLQVVSIGILRGVADTRGPMIINVVGFWVVGLPISIWLGFRMGLGPRGLWWGLVAGLAAVAIILLARVRSRMRGAVTRIDLDAPAIPAA